MPNNIQGLPPGATLKPISGLPPGAELRPLNGNSPSAPSADAPQKSTLQQLIDSSNDVAIGALKGAGMTAYRLGKLLIPDALVGGDNGRDQRVAHALSPANAQQTGGRAAEQAGEFLAPGAAEEAIAAKLAPYVGKAMPLVKTGLAALGTGAVNKVQGGDFGTGALAGGVSSGAAQALHSVAPAIAESAIGIRKIDRAYGRTPGRAILDETRGVTPSAVADSAQQVLNSINPKLESLMRTNAVAPVDLGPARNIVDQAQNTAIARNAAGSFNQLNPMANHLAANFATGQRFPQMVAPIDALNLKRGFGDEFVHNWNPETMKGTKSVAAQTYHELAEQIHSSAPGSAELDERASSLIPVAKRAESTELNAPPGQRILHRFGAHTGALAGGLLGAKQGYDERGLPGAVLGGTVGVALPELVASPTGQIITARTFNSPYSAQALRYLAGAGLQLAPRKNEPEE